MFISKVKKLKSNCSPLIISMETRISIPTDIEVSVLIAWIRLAPPMKIPKKRKIADRTNCNEAKLKSRIK